MLEKLYTLEGEEGEEFVVVKVVAVAFKDVGEGKLLLICCCCCWSTNLFVKNGRGVCGYANKKALIAAGKNKLEAAKTFVALLLLLIVVVVGGVSKAVEVGGELTRKHCFLNFKLCFSKWKHGRENKLVSLFLLFFKV